MTQNPDSQNSTKVEGRAIAVEELAAEDTIVEDSSQGKSHELKAERDQLVQRYAQINKNFDDLHLNYTRLNVAYNQEKAKREKEEEKNKDLEKKAKKKRWILAAAFLLGSAAGLAVSNIPGCEGDSTSGYERNAKHIPENGGTSEYDSGNGSSGKGSSRPAQSKTDPHRNKERVDGLEKQLQQCHDELKECRDKNTELYKRPVSCPAYKPCPPAKECPYIRKGE